MTDYLWNGDLATVTGAVFNVVTDPISGDSISIPQPGLSVIGPVVVGGVAYVNVRTQTVLTLPSGLSATDPAVSLSVLGEWA